MLKAKDIMTKNVLIAKADTSFNDVVKVFTDSKIRHLPITNSNGILRAIISSSDVLKAIHEMDQFAINYNGFSLEKRLEVDEEMSSDVVSVVDDLEIKEVIGLMLENDVHALPVVNNNSVVGIITSNDILRAISKGEIVI